MKCLQVLPSCRLVNIADHPPPAGHFIEFVRILSRSLQYRRSPEQFQFPMKNDVRKTHPFDHTAGLARSITWAGSKQTYTTARLLVDKELVNDCYRAYAYFRWADDVVDADDQSETSSEERIAFISRQKALIEQFYRDERPDDLIPEEEMVADLISHDQGENQGLVSFIHNFLAILEFDANRRGRLISQQELTWYSNCLAKAVTDGIQYFIGHSHPYPITDNRYLAVIAAHITHMLRDMLPDIADGYINIPKEYITANRIIPGNVNDLQFRTWVRNRVELARRYLRAGKGYLEGLEVLRCKLAGFWYCARYEGVLDAIERDGYVLRKAYKRSPFTWFRIAWLGVTVTVRHVIRRVFSARQGRRGFWKGTSDSKSETAVNRHREAA